MEELEKVIEAALFMSARPISLGELLHAASSCGTYSITEIKNAIKNLQSKYNESWIEIAEVGRSYTMRLKKEHVEKVGWLAKEVELGKAALRVLALVSKHGNIFQSRVAKILGPSTYDGVKELVEKDFVIAKKAGRTKILSPSKKFKIYFGEEG